MNLEQLALLGIALFAFMALASSFNAIRSFKRMSPGKLQRVRRLIGGDASALTMARSVVTEVKEKHPQAALESKELGMLAHELEEPLEEARTYFLGRVENRHRALFNRAVDENHPGARTPGPAAEQPLKTPALKLLTESVDTTVNHCYKVDLVR